VNVGSSGKKTLTLGIPGSGLSYQFPLTWMSLGLVAVVAIVLVGLAFLLAPDLIRAALHWWQPKIF
jgi:hypothetical protein